VSRWFLGSPVSPDGTEIDPRIFTSGVRQDVPGGLLVPLRRHGSPVAFNFCDFDMIVSLAQVNQRLQEETSAVIQRVPVTVEGATANYEILNVCQSIPCFDSNRSTFQRWLPGDGRPDRTGALRMVLELRIDRAAAGSADLFQVAEWPVALVASERAKSVLVAAGASGLAFESVS
jgi:hypothetical protein